MGPLAFSPAKLLSAIVTITITAVAVIAASAIAIIAATRGVIPMRAARYTPYFVVVPK